MFQIPIEEIPEDFVPLKNYFKILLDKTCEKFFLLILLGRFLVMFWVTENKVSGLWVEFNLEQTFPLIKPKFDNFSKLKVLRKSSNMTVKITNLSANYLYIFV